MYRLRHRAQGRNRVLGSRFDAVAHHHGIGAERRALQAFVDNSLREDDRGGRAVARLVIGLCRDLFHDARTHVLEFVGERDLFGDRNAVVGDGRPAPRFVECDVAPPRTDGDLDRARDDVDAALQRISDFLIEDNLFCHNVLYLRIF